MAARALTHRLRVAGTVSLAGTVEHSPLSIVHRAASLAYERNEGIIANLVKADIVAFETFEAVNAFCVEYVGPFAVYSGRHMKAVQVEHQVISSCRFGSLVDKLFQFLVVAVEEVDFKAFNTHVGVMPAHCFKVFLEGRVTCPQYDTHFFVCGIFY